MSLKYRDAGIALYFISDIQGFFLLKLHLAEFKFKVMTNKNQLNVALQFLTIFVGLPSLQRW